MKKFILLSLIVLFGLTLSACEGPVEEVDEANVIFFVGNNNPNTIPSLLNVTVNEPIEAPEEPVRPGFVFQGWYKDVELTTPWDFENDIVESSVVLYSKWEAAIFSINYDLNDGQIIGTNYPTEFSTGDFLPLPIATKVGYNFLGWYPYDWIDESSTIPGDPGYQTIPRNQISDLDIYAHWEAIVVQILFRSNYPVESEGPNNPSSQSLAYGEIINFPQLNDTADYNFIGWNSNPEGTGTYYNNGDIFTRQQRLILYAIWEEN